MLKKRVLNIWFHEREFPFDTTEILVPSEEYKPEGLRIDKYNSLPKFFKEIFDRLFSIFVLVMFFPFLVIIGIIIKIDSKGPVFFKQERVGLDGKKFNIYKFRTMHKDAERAKRKLIKDNEASGPMFKIRNDPRITSIGKILRKTGLDEIPQLVNVTKGEMSLIGPRPPLEPEVLEFEKEQMRKLSVKPGISCTWQIHPKRHEVEFDEWIQMDLDYIDNWTLKKDASIFFSSVKSIFVAGGH